MTEAGMMARRREFDLVVVGSGAGGLCAALAAAARGLRVLVAEKTEWFGGTTALSEGMIWVPGGTAALARGAVDSPADALGYLRAAAPDTLPEVRARAYCDNAAEMLAFVERESRVRYEIAATSLDYYDQLPGATHGTRAYRPGVFDARGLDRKLFDRIRAPLATTVAFGGMMLSSPDYAHVLAMRRSLRSVVHIGSISARFCLDRLRGYGRGTRLTNGNGVVAGLLQAVASRGVELWNRAAAIRLCRDGDRVCGVVLEVEGTTVEVAGRLGVVLATGGFPGHHGLRREYLPHVAQGLPHVSLAPASNTGDGIVMARSVGAALDGRLRHPAAWTPVSLVPTPTGSVPFPHYVDRAKPGIVAVDARGRRFCNEAAPYIRFVPELVASMRAAGGSAAWLICDARALRRYGLGAVPPAPGRIRPYLRSGYLKCASTLGVLASEIAVPSASLESTIEEWNADAATGRDTRFQRGNSAFDRAYGDPESRPNPCMGAIERAPFYAVQLLPGDIGTFVGLDTDRHARVRTPDGSIVRGLYAAGNDVASPTGGEYPAAGVTIGAAMTFGYLAGTHAAVRGPECAETRSDSE